MRSLPLGLKEKFNAVLLALDEGNLQYIERIRNQLGLSVSSFSDVLDWYMENRDCEHYQLEVKIYGEKRK